MVVPFAEFFWRCILRKQLEKLLAIVLGIMSAAILLAEATLLPSGVDLSLFSILINSVKEQEVLMQVDCNVSNDSSFSNYLDMFCIESVIVSSCKTIEITNPSFL